MNHLILNQAHRLLQLKQRSFQREIIYIPEESKIQCDCSGLINIILSIILNKSPSQKYRACDYFDLIEHQKIGVAIYSFDQLLPGDLLIWKKEKVPRSGDSGHISIIEKIESSTQTLREVSIIDSTKTPHFYDQRKCGPGQGTIKLEVNSEEAMIGVQWSQEKKKIKRTRIIGARLNYELVKDFF